MRTRKRNYSVKLHAYRIELMLKRIEQKKLRMEGCCPAAIQFGYCNSQPWKDTCEICRNFVNMPKSPYPRCPCWAFGSFKETLDVTISALALYNLERKGGK